MQTFPDVRRQEDARLLSGEGHYADDIQLPDMCFGQVLRSTCAHASLLRIDTRTARELPGVLQILTRDDLRRDGIGELPCVSELTSADGSKIYKPPRPILAAERVRHVGEPIAFVVAESAAIACDAAEMIEVEYAELPCAMAHDSDAGIYAAAPGNVCFDWSDGNDQIAAEALAQAAHVTRITVTHPRMAVTPLEPRAAVAELDAATDRLTLYAQTQGVHSVQRVLARGVLKIPLAQLRVVTGDVGGSFGMKIFTYPEYALVLIAARKLRRAVKWTASRSESFVSDSHGRARTDQAELGLDADGQFVALRIRATADLGAYLSHVGPSVPTLYANMVTGHTYRIPAIAYRCRGLFTNAPPTDAYRGAGKPETTCTLEQLIDKAAFEMQIDRIALRRMNFVKPQQLPYTMPNGQVIDSGNFGALLDRALEISDWEAFPRRREQAARQGKRLGIGLGMYLHSTSLSTGETCEIKLRADGTVLLLTGSQSGGQGHVTALAQIAAEALRIDARKIEVVQGDTQVFDTGAGTGGSQLLATSGNTVLRAARQFLDNLKAAAAQLLEAPAADIEYASGAFVIAGTDRKIAFEQIPSRIEQAQMDAAACTARVGFDGVPVTHPSGAYVAEIECDIDTGELRIRQLAGVDDLGKILFPALADGQLHGAWAQAIGGCLMEAVVFDDHGSGQLLSGSLMDYQLPRAKDLPFLRLEKMPTMCTTNALGVKGAGEVACLGAPGAILNALSCLLSQERFEVIKPPATAYRIWQTMQMQSA